MIISSILLTLMFDSGVILLREIRSWSLLGVKGLSGLLVLSSYPTIPCGWLLDARSTDWCPKKIIGNRKLYVGFHLSDATKDDVMSYLFFSRTMNGLVYAFFRPLHILSNPWSKPNHGCSRTICTFPNNEITRNWFTNHV